jgi:hypothetical protein
MKERIPITDNPILTKNPMLVNQGMTVRHNPTKTAIAGPLISFEFFILLILL